ncbi:hypothetical protein [Streptomyces sp. NPDC059783]|uniref:hypothetical protein n=1 Tax=Streptomyces sp. NPDC059783 TaxID=3346944 RepID=UPI0036494D29
MNRTTWIAWVLAVIAVGATGCDTGGTGAGTSAPKSVAPRPQGTGPLPEKVVRADLDTTAAEAGVPNNAPDYARSAENRTDGSLASCTVAFKGYGTKAEPADPALFDRVVSGLHERDWRESRQREEDTRGGSVAEARVVLEQRGWTLIASYQDVLNGVITLQAAEDSCVEGVDGDVGLFG